MIITIPLHDGNGIYIYIYVITSYYISKMSPNIPTGFNPSEKYEFVSWED